MNIGLDLDGVVYDFHSAMYTYGTVYEGFEGTFTEFWLEYFPSLSKEDQAYLISLEHLYMTRPLSDKMKKVLNDLASLGTIYYITARDESLSLVSEKFLKKNKVPFKDNLIMTKDKASYAKLLKLDFFVDDFTKYVKEVRKPTLSFLMAKPWNRDAREEFPTIYSLRELYNIIKEN